MVTVEKSVLVGYSAARMYALVEDIEAYPQFLPWCSGARVAVRDARKTVATLLVNYHGLRQQFTTENLKQDATLIEIRLIDGPFRKLDGFWRFLPLGDAACKIEFSLSYEISGMLLEKMAGPVFGHIANTFVEAFVRRASTVYGP
jgi:ribosome-associated toxin RatA of RatAB toxin-antitoxin module